MANAEVFYVSGIPTQSLPGALAAHAGNTNCIRVTLYKQVIQGQVSWHLEAMYRVVAQPQPATASAAPRHMTVEL